MLNHSPSSFFETGHHNETGAHSFVHAGWLISCGIYLSLYPSFVELWTYIIASALKVGPEDLNAGSHVYTVEILLTEAPTHLYSSFIIYHSKITWLVIKKTIFLPFPIHSFIFHPNYTPPSWSSFPWPLASPLSSTSEKGKVPNTWYPPTLASQVTVGLGTSLRPEKTVQLGERDPQTGNRVRVSHHSSCWKTHVKRKLHICYLCVKDLDTAAHVWSSVSDLVSMTLQGFRFFDSVSIPVESLSLPLVSSFLPLILSRPPELHLTLGYESLHLFWLAAVLSFSESVLLGSCLWIHDDRYKHSLRLQSSWRRKAGQQYFPNDSLRR